MTNFNENAIREAAYYIWKNNGCPANTSAQDWNAAINQLNAMAAAKTTTKKATKKVGAKASSLNIVSKPVIMNNLSKKAGSLKPSKPVMAKPFYGIKK